MLHFFANLLTESVVILFYWLVLFPIVWLVATPFIFIVAGFRKEPYWFAVVQLFLSVHDWWEEWGVMVAP